MNDCLEWLFYACTYDNGKITGTPISCMREQILHRDWLKMGVGKISIGPPFYKDFIFEFELTGIENSTCVPKPCTIINIFTGH